MHATALPVPGIVLGNYPERSVATDGTGARRAAQLRAWANQWAGSGAYRYRRFVARVRALDAQTGKLDAAALQQHVSQLRAKLSRDGLQESLMAEAFVLITRACAQELRVSLYDTQLMAARIMLDKQLAEMATGEGKTLTAALAAATAALAGIPVHVMTANDYLVARDAEALRPLYSALGLSVGAVTQPLDAAGRMRAYGCDITYCTAKEIVFDYLRDGMLRGRARGDLLLRASQLGTGGARQTLLRGLCMALVDEADSILIDEARVPLILSQSCSNPGEVDCHQRALEVAAQMSAGQDFVLDRAHMSAMLKPAGRSTIERCTAGLGAVWRHRLHREEIVCTALAALHLYARDRHYLVRDRAVHIIDENTGRLAAGRIWSGGLHQLIELKEGCPVTGGQVTAAQMTYQRFFQRYLAVGGMSGTLSEARAELLSVYGLHVQRVPLLRPSRRSVLPTRLYPDADAQWRAVVAQAGEISRAGRPVLIGTDSVSDSERLSRHLDQAGLPHAVLNARHDRDEAQIVARAGEPGQITVATNMAGRGTDIPLAPGVAERGGLHLVCCQHNASRRIDRQLLGRCARQGDPGSAQTLIALDKPLISRLFPAWLLPRLGHNGRADPRWLVALVVRLPQLLEESRQRAQRRALLEQDSRLARHPGMVAAVE